MRAPVFFRYILIGILLFVLLVSLPSRMFCNIKPGHYGVIVSKFSGVQKTRVLSPGFKVIAPWHHLVMYDVRLQGDTQTVAVLAKNGVPVTCVLSYFYRPDKDRLANLNDEITPDYKSKIIVQEVRAAVWKVFGKYQPEELISTKRDSVQEELQQITSQALDKKYILLDKVLIKQITLPPTLQSALIMNATQQLASSIDTTAQKKH